MTTRGLGATAAFFEPSSSSSRAHHSPTTPRSSSSNSSNSNSPGFVWPIIWGVCFAFGVIMGSTTTANRVVIPAHAARAELKPTPMLRGSKPSATRTVHGRSEDSAGGTRHKKPFARKRDRTLKQAPTVQREADDTGRHAKGTETEKNDELESSSPPASGAKTTTTKPPNKKDNDYNISQHNDDADEKTTKTSTSTTPGVITIVTGDHAPLNLMSGGGPEKGDRRTTNKSRMLSRMWRLNDGQWGPTEEEGGEIVAELAKPKGV